MITDEQRQNRIIGASDAAALLGVSRYKTRRQLYEELVGNVPRDDVSNNARVRIGNALESLIIDMHDEELDLSTHRNPETFRLQKHIWATVHLDGIIGLAGGINVEAKKVGRDMAKWWGESGTDSIDPEYLPQVHMQMWLVNVEAKKVGRDMAKWWGEPGTDDIDPEYLPQVHMQMWAANCERTHVAVLVGDDDFRIYYVDRDREMDQLIAQVGDWFWDKVQTGHPPPMDHDHVSTLPLLKKMYPGTSGETIELPDDIEHWDTVMQEASAKIKLYQGTVDCAKAHILELMETSAIGTMSSGYEFVRQHIAIPARQQDAYEYIKLTRRKTRAKRGN